MSGQMIPIYVYLRGVPKKTHFQSMMQPSSTKQSKPDPTRDCLLLSALDCLVEEGCIML